MDRTSAGLHRGQARSLAGSGRAARFRDGQVAAWQVPENWTFLDELPKTTVGKFDKKVLRARYRSGELDVQRTKP